MNISRVLVGDAQALSALASRSFMAAFAADNSVADMQQYVNSAFSLQATSRELHDPLNTFLWATPRVGECLSQGESKSVGDARDTVSVDPVGYVKVRRGGEVPECVSGARCVELQRLYVAPEQVGSGIGHKLMRAAMETTHREGFQTMWLGVWENNTHAIRFYQRHGFVTVGSHQFLLGKDLQTDLVMQLTTVS
jgi:ribosomal protein S18 acetylase RimI-like enzyme